MYCNMIVVRSNNVSMVHLQRWSNALALRRGGHTRWVLSKASRQEVPSICKKCRKEYLESENHAAACRYHPLWYSGGEVSKVRPLTGVWAFPQFHRNAGKMSIETEGTSNRVGGRSRWSRLGPLISVDTPDLEWCLLIIGGLNFRTMHCCRLLGFAGRVTCQKIS